MNDVDKLVSMTSEHENNIILRKRIHASNISKIMLHW